MGSISSTYRCVYFSVLAPPKYGQITGYWKGIKKGGKYELVKSKHIFPPIDLKYTKLQKKGWKFFPPHNNKVLLGKKYKSRRGGGGQKYELQI